VDATRLTPRQALLVGEACALAIVLPALLRLSTTQRLLQRLEPRRPSGERDDRLFGGTSRQTDRVIRRLPWMAERGCLPRAMILFRQGRRCGMPVEFHLGVRRGREGLEGHAWVTLDGVVVGEAGDPASIYRITWSFPESSPVRLAR
jgi:hypothetical protein